MPPNPLLTPAPGSPRGSSQGPCTEPPFKCLNSADFPPRGTHPMPPSPNPLSFCPQSPSSHRAGGPGFHLLPCSLCA